MERSVPQLSSSAGLRYLQIVDVVNEVVGAGEGVKLVAVLSADPSGFSGLGVADV